MKNYRSWVGVLVVIALVPMWTSCKGGLCAATEDPLQDADGDCTADAGDNCASVYNPSQFDGDADGVGEACDSDDGDDAVATSVSASQSATPDGASYVFPDSGAIAEAAFDAESNCAYFLIGCDGAFLGNVNADPES